MEQFNLDKWLQDKNRKVVTRHGRPVTIICPKSPYNTIVGFCGKHEYPDLWDLNGKYLKCKDSVFDLFFADEKKCNKILNELKSYLKSTPKEQIEKDWQEIQDWYVKHFTDEEHNEEDELTKFEEAVQNVLNEPHFQDVQAVKQFSKSLLDLARKELEKEYRIVNKDDCNWEDGYKRGYKQCKTS